MGVIRRSATSWRDYGQIWDHVAAPTLPQPTNCCGNSMPRLRCYLTIPVQVHYGRNYAHGSAATR